MQADMNSVGMVAKSPIFPLFGALPPGPRATQCILLERWGAPITPCRGSLFLHVPSFMENPHTPRLLMCSNTTCAGAPGLEPYTPHPRNGWGVDVLAVWDLHRVFSTLPPPPIVMRSERIGWAQRRIYAVLADDEPWLQAQGSRLRALTPNGTLVAFQQGDRIVTPAKRAFRLHHDQWVPTAFDDGHTFYWPHAHYHLSQMDMRTYQEPRYERLPD
jgi:hypothetical protein